jgi:hypothetical protein
MPYWLAAAGRRRRVVRRRDHRNRRSPAAERWRAVAAELPWPRPDGWDAPPAGEPPPYRGLAAYEPDDAQWFFGRERLVTELLDRLADRRFLAVFGPSGSGKSSLLRRSAGPDPGRWADRWSRLATVLMTPGPHPLAGLSAHLGSLARPATGEPPNDLTAAARRVLSTEPSEAELLLVVDQFEEVFTLCGDPTERADFVSVLLTAAQSPDSRVRVVGRSTWSAVMCGPLPA